MPMKALRDGHPARKTFQAIRIEVNHELDYLETSLKNKVLNQKLLCGQSERL